ncbi:hypothetical protein BCR33DRAFT_222216 [Rhizoclosmatium globosum]|uniref:MMS19 C-terminal domain-containing protein n=1 Tax=Rhizoclosmatium globosum TaxID=329046 RepID=A0A1Y2CBN9_9FUNG|nr:hypothetical protein BCR33DRAFT_222216 [Rhizoclosmatium globosum]|eukprot:ORY44448.1 hypothetical protein BCR33DRAFT_222216 [Rhizoclosmatium globosum]
MIHRLESSAYKRVFCQIIVVWKQKLFKHCLPILVDGFSNSTEDLKSNYLLALSHLMKYVSKSVILYEIQNVSVYFTRIRVNNSRIFPS